MRSPEARPALDGQTCNLTVSAGDKSGPTLEPAVINKHDSYNYNIRNLFCVQEIEFLHVYNLLHQEHQENGTLHRIFV
mgnify:CR=1 FL=1